MFLSIYHNQSGAEYVRRLAPRESLDLRRHISQWVERETDGLARPSFAEAGAHIPNGCAEYQAELRDTKRESGSCWTSEPFFLAWEGEG